MVPPPTQTDIELIPSIFHEDSCFRDEQMCVSKVQAHEDRRTDKHVLFSFKGHPVSTDRHLIVSEIKGLDDIVFSFHSNGLFFQTCIERRLEVDSNKPLVSPSRISQFYDRGN